MCSCACQRTMSAGCLRNDHCRHMGYLLSLQFISAPDLPASIHLITHFKLHCALSYSAKCSAALVPADATDDIPLLTNICWHLQQQSSAGQLGEKGSLKKLVANCPRCLLSLLKEMLAMHTHTMFNAQDALNEAWRLTLHFWFQCSGLAP
jgi:hypothetical protein